MEGVWTLLGGGVGSALVGGIFALIQWRLSRKALCEDHQGQAFRELKDMVTVLAEADRTLLYDRIKDQGKAYLLRGWITLEELEDINRMHQVYHDPDKLNGNGFLDDLMCRVRKLEVKGGME